MRVRAWLELGKALADLHLIACGIFPIVPLHLRMDEVRDVALIPAQHFPGVIFRKIPPKMIDRLGGKVVEQVRVIVVGNIVEVDQTADDVILQPIFFNPGLAQRDDVTPASAEMLDPQLVRHSRVAQRSEIQREGLEAGAHLARRHNQNARNIDGLLGDDVDGLGNNRRDVRLLSDALQTHLRRGALGLDSFHNRGLDLRALQIFNRRQGLGLVFQGTEMSCVHIMLLHFLEDQLDLVARPWREVRHGIVAGKAGAAERIGIASGRAQQPLVGKIF